MTWTTEMLVATLNRYEFLRVEEGASALVGRLEVCGYLNAGKLVLYPSPDLLMSDEAQATLLTDSFDVTIGANGRGPYLRLLGDRVLQTAAKFGKPLIDFHLYDDQSACVAAPQELLRAWQAGLGPGQYIEKYVVPFLYAQAFLEKHGKWPWKELSHGPAGILEWLGRIKCPSQADIFSTALCLALAGKLGLVAERARTHCPCPCGSKKRLKDCHPELKLAVSHIRCGLTSTFSQRELARLRDAANST